LPEYQEYYEEIILCLVRNHAHKHSGIRLAKLKKKLSDGLDYDEVEDVLEEVVDEFGFVEHGRTVRYYQNRECLEYLDEEASIDLKMYEDSLNHITPPKLRREFGLRPPEG
jgi:hypothetical protein